MKKLLLITLILTSITTYSQEEKIQMISKFDYPEDNREYVMGNFLGIDKLDFSFTNSEKLIGKNFKITLRKYKNGKIEIEKIVINTKGEGLPTIKKDFKFSLITQQILNNEKIAFFFPGFFNKQIFIRTALIFFLIYDFGLLILPSLTTGRLIFIMLCLFQIYIQKTFVVNKKLYVLSFRNSSNLYKCL